MNYLSFGGNIYILGCYEFKIYIFCTLFNYAAGSRTTDDGGDADSVKQLQEDITKRDEPSQGTSAASGEQKDDQQGK